MTSEKFPIAGLGASAGGLEAITQVVSQLEPDTAMAFVVLQHFDPHFPSSLAAILQEASKLPVLDAEHGAKILPAHIYVCPSDMVIEVAGGVWHLTPRAEMQGNHLSIDILFRSLAKELEGAALGIVLSGTGADGTLGLAEIKAAGGVAFAQDPNTAKHSGMPHSAISSGMVDFVLPPSQIGEQLTRLGRHPLLGGDLTEEGASPPNQEAAFVRLISILQSTFGVNFSLYRDSTIKRRAQRRMILKGKDTLFEYAKSLESDPLEVESLYYDVLINVTSFFRDPLTFEALRAEVFPEVHKAKTAHTPIRIWVPGCSTGQEAYSIAMALVEFLESRAIRPPVQIFATDIGDRPSLDKARTGLYPDTIEAEVSPERLRRFFSKEDGKYRISKAIRDMCVFAKQDVTADPPFSHVDIISCRNVLIYLGPQLQRRVIPTFHYALNPGGFLVLGASETVGSFAELFTLFDKGNKIYRKGTGTFRQYPHFNREGPSMSSAGEGGSLHKSTPTLIDLQKEADRFLLGQYAPAGVLVNSDYEILQFRGRTSPYLEQPPGQPSSNLLEMARDGLFVELKGLLTEAKEADKVVERRNIVFRHEGTSRAIDLRVVPVHGPGLREACYLVLFEESAKSSTPSAPNGRGAAHVPTSRREEIGERSPLLGRVWQALSGRGVHSQHDPLRRSLAERDGELERLQRELSRAREEQLVITQQQDAANEELRAANEEILSSNEELQSTNEELETAKEELQSVNEELTTVNEQLQQRNLELNLSNNDLSNLLASSSIPIVMLGADLRIRRFTPSASKLFNIVQSDLGRRMHDVQSTFDLADFDEMVEQVVDSVQVQEKEVRDRRGRWYSLRIHPYRTADNKIDGAVVVAVDIDKVKSAQERLEAIMDTVRDPLLVLDSKFVIKTANRAFFRAFQLNAPETIDRFVFDLGRGEWQIPVLRTLLEEIVPKQIAVDDYVLEHTFPQLGKRTMLVNVRRFPPEGKYELILLSMEDVTDRRRDEFALREQSDALKEAARRKDEFLAMLAHELRNPLAPVRFATEILRQPKSGPAEKEHALALMERQVRHLSRLVDDLMDVARISRGKISLTLAPTDLSQVISLALEMSRPFIEARKHALSCDLPAERVVVNADLTRLSQVFSNLLNNAAKYTEPGGQISISARVDGREVAVSVRDNGTGIEPQILPQVFDLFTQANPSLDRSQGGLGIGLTVVKQLVEMHGGTVAAASDGIGQGSQFTVRLPCTVASSALQPGDPSATTAAEDIQVSSKGRRVLVIDDNEDFLDSLTTYLQLKGADVRFASNGATAIEAARQFHPELVLLDIGLPGMSGHDTASKLRELPFGRDLQIIALSGYGSDEQRALSRQAGFDMHLVKPIEPSVIDHLLS